MGHPIEKWFTGKALTTNQTYVLPTLAEAKALGYWPKGASRKVVAALNKQNVAIKFARANDRRDSGPIGDRSKHPEGLLTDVQDIRGERGYESTLRGWSLVHVMMFGQVYRAPEAFTLCNKLEQHCWNDAERAAMATARRWAEDFTPIAELLELLDSRRPIPVVICKTLSRTVVDNLGRSMGLALDTIAFPEIEWHWEERKGKDGKLFRIAVPTILWPKGTKHGMSRYARGTTHNDQCHACGHAIKKLASALRHVEGRRPRLAVGRARLRQEALRLRCHGRGRLVLRPFVKGTTK